MKNSVFARIYIFALFGLSFAGCSTSYFGSDAKKDLPKSETGQISQACKGIDASEASIKPEAARQLIQCMNSNGSIASFESLVNTLSDAEFRSTVQILNENLVTNKKRISDLGKSIDQLEQNGTYSRFFASLTHVLENKKFIDAVSKIFREGMTENGTLDREQLKVIEVLAKEIRSDAGARENFRALIEVLQATVKHPAWKSMVEGSRLPIPFGKPALRALSRKFMEYVQAKTLEKPAMGRVVYWGIADGSLLKGWDHFLASHREFGSPVTPADQIQAFESLLRFLHVTNKSTLKDMDELFSLMDQPIRCMDDTKRIENAAVFVMERFLTWDPVEVPFLRASEEVARLMVSASVCELPDGFGKITKVLADFSGNSAAEASSVSHRPLVTSTQFLHSLTYADKVKMSAEARLSLKDHIAGYPEDQRFRRFLIAALGDKSEVNSFTNLAEIIAELSDSRRVMADFLYLLDGLLGQTNPDRVNELRPKIQGALKAFMREREELGGKSAYDMASKAWMKIDLETFADLIEGMSEFVDEDAEVFAPLFGSIRDGLMTNNTQPVVDMVLDVMENATRYASFFDVLISRTGTPESDNALLLLTRMCQTGVIKDFISSTLRFLGVVHGQNMPSPQPVPAIESLRASSERDTLNELRWNPKPIYWPGDAHAQEALAACKKFDFNVSLGNPQGGDWLEQMGYLAKCSNISGKFNGLESALVYANQTRLENGQTLGQALVGQMTGVLGESGQTRKHAYDVLTDLLTSDSRLSDIRDVHKAAGLLIGSESKPAAKFLSALNTFSDKAFNDLKAVMKRFAPLTVDFEGKGDVDLLTVYAKIKDAAEIDRKVKVTKPALIDELQTRLELLAAIKAHEGEAGSEEKLKSRIADYFTNSRLDIPHFNYRSPEEFKALWRPVFDRLADKGKPSVDRLLEFFDYIEDAPYDPEWLSGWLVRLASHVRPIRYFQPGTNPKKDKPEVILVNDLDLLELIAENADFSLKELHQPLGLIFENPHSNFSVKYFSLLAQSGDKLMDFVDATEKEFAGYLKLIRFPGVGVAVKKELKRRLYNLEQVLPLLRELAQREETVVRNGKTLVRNDLGILRDLFMSALRATPQEQWNDYRRDVNSLARIVDIAQSGVFRTIGPQLVQKDSAGRLVALDSSHIIRIFMKLNSAAGRKLMEFAMNGQGDVQSADFNKRFPILGLMFDSAFAWSGNAQEISEVKATAFELLKLMDSSGAADIVPALAEALSTKTGADGMMKLYPKFNTLLSGSKLMRVSMILNEQVRAGQAEDFKRVILKMNKLTDGDTLIRTIALAGEAVEDKTGKWAECKDAFDALALQREWIDLRKTTLDRLGDEFLDWIASPVRNDLQLRLLEFAARQSVSGETVMLLKFAARENESLINQISFIGQPEYVNGLDSFMRDVRAGLQDNFAH